MTEHINVLIKSSAENKTKKKPTQQQKAKPKTEKDSSVYVFLFLSEIFILLSASLPCNVPCWEGQTGNTVGNFAFQVALCFAEDYMLEVPVYLSSVLFGIRGTWQFKKGRKLLFDNFSYISIASTKKVDRSFNAFLKVHVYKSVQLLCASVRKFWNNLGWMYKRIILSWICHMPVEFTGHVYLKCFSKILFVVFFKEHM